MNGDSGYQWNQTLNGQGTNSLSIDTGLAARSMPGTPATTPPGNGVPNSQYQQSPNFMSKNGYPSQQHMYPPSNGDSYGRYGPSTYIKNEMGPPSRTLGAEADHEAKSNGMSQAPEGPTGDEEAEHETDAEYTHNSATYDTHRGSYYTNGASANPLNEHLSPDMTGSPGHQSGRATPRTTAPPQPYYQQQGGYSTPPRALPPSSNLYNVMSSERGTANGTSEVYPQTDLSMQNGYAQPIINGVGTGKRSRDEDDDGSRPGSRGPDSEGLKRRKTIGEVSISSQNGPTTYDAGLNRTRSIIAQRRR